MVKTVDFKKFIDDLLKPVNNKAGEVGTRIKALLPSAGDEIIQYKDFQRLGKGLLRATTGWCGQPTLYRYSGDYS